LVRIRTVDKNDISRLIANKRVASILALIMTKTIGTTKGLRAVYMLGVFLQID